MESSRFDVIIIGGSYAGLSAAMSLGRSRRKVLVIDSGRPCNRQTPHAHNLITHDGEPPAQIRQAALEQVLAYSTVQLLEGFAESVSGTSGEFVVKTAAGEAFESKRILLATGVRDTPLPIDGFAECWGISVLHCPYCHGYEVRDETLGVIGNGDMGFDYARLIRHWTPRLQLLTNGPATLSGEQREKLESQAVRIEERPIQAIRHQAGRMEAVVFDDGDELPLTAMFARGGIEQHSDIPARLELELQTDGMIPALIKVDAFGRTSMGGIMAAGDNCIPFRSLANAIGAGTTAGAFLNNELIVAEF
jgi:thioredoxin reductase